MARAADHQELTIVVWQHGHCWTTALQCTTGLINDIWFRGICVELKAEVRQDKLSICDQKKSEATAFLFDVSSKCRM